MSFLNITDPQKRDKLVKEFLETKRNIQANFLSDRLGGIEMKREFTKVFAPITETQKETQKAIAEIPKQLALPAPTIGPSSAIEQSPSSAIGNTAASYLKTYLGNKSMSDTKYGIYTKGDDKFYIGNKQVTIDDDDIVIGDNKYTGTPGLWELITRKDPKNYSIEDLKHYSSILNSTNAMYVDYDPNKRLSSNQGTKWKNIVGPIWQKKPLTIREIPASTDTGDPDKLLDRYCLLLSSKEAGNTGVNDEMVQIVNELHKQNEFRDDDEYKFMLAQAQN